MLMLSVILKVVEFANVIINQFSRAAAQAVVSAETPITGLFKCLLSFP